MLSFTVTHLYWYISKEQTYNYKFILQ
uniref:Uncharacterized protein n=1 Tax=Anguilla anguilla TaxID=7936 RepID=A0A0E9U4V2_ANGAN